MSGLGPLPIGKWLAIYMAVLHFLLGFVGGVLLGLVLVFIR